MSDDKWDRVTDIAIGEVKVGDDGLEIELIDDPEDYDWWTFDRAETLKIARALEAAQDKMSDWVDQERGPLWQKAGDIATGLVREGMTMSQIAPVPSGVNIMVTGDIDVIAGLWPDAQPTLASDTAFAVTTAYAVEPGIIVTHVGIKGHDVPRYTDFDPDDPGVKDPEDDDDPYDEHDEARWLADPEGE